jgi:hypothetical protein
LIFTLYALAELSSEYISVSVKDQFCPPTGEEVTITAPWWLAVAVQKTVDSEVTSIMNRLQHLMCYGITGGNHTYLQAQVADQFLAQTLTLGDPAWTLGVPTLNLSWDGPYNYP